MSQCHFDDDTRVDHSDVTATSSKLPYKAVFPPNKGIKKSCDPPGFSDLFTYFVTDT